MDHSFFIHRCLTLAEHGRGHVGINPLVGAVLVRQEKIIAEAWHEGFGLPHAERRLLEAYQGEIQADDVLYVNLEPCCHTGKTPPCTEIILKRGVKNVVYGMEDPNSEVQGNGLKVLRSKGLKVIGPVEMVQCEWLNRGFISLQKQHRPWITLKRAQTRDGRIAAVDGSPLTITSHEQDVWSHTRLRSEHDAILVGVGTIVSDNPQLTVRVPADQSAKREGSNTRFIQDKNTEVDQLSPLRIVLDPKLRLQENAQILSKKLAMGTVVIAGEGLQEKKERIRALGARVWECELVEKAFDWQVLWELLTTPLGDFHGITSILVEGGSKTWKVFQEAGMVDEEVVLVGEN
ncbi:MAG: bifunctional diaminohydroxyphosphoribosylaminopyrimidine deaminase/5-amino-6-(5-phosphoribosylamino)uracil reductase RibD [Candidatus Peribacteraceae bacterium]